MDITTSESQNWDSYMNLCVPDSSEIKIAIFIGLVLFGQNIPLKIQ